MTPERWQLIDKLLEQALEQEPERRGVFLDQVCNGDVALRQEVQSLLSAHGKADGFTEAGPMRTPPRKTGGEDVQLPTGRQVGHYQILSRLGEGGMGIVYKAHDQHLDRFVAIKVLPPQLVADPDRKRRFVQEAKAASALKHPNIITIHDIASDNDIHFIVMEYVDGKTLGEMIPRRGMKLNEALKVAIQIADALAKAHSAGIIHRDLKPGNIMLGEDGLVKVLDFGLAKLSERPQAGQDELTGTMPSWTDEGTILGTASYMSPEQAAGKPVDARSDIFSFGSVLYEMVTGQRAFQGDSKMSTLAAVLNQEPKPASEISRALPRDLEKIIGRCLRKDPSRRFQHMADLKVALEELKEESDSQPLGVKEGIDSSGKPKRFSLVRWVTLATAVVSLAVAAWFWLSRSTTVQRETVLTAVPLTTYPGHERFPAFSPDGNQIAFSWNGERQDNFDIYVKLIGTGPPLRLTTHPAEDWGAAWSPDGHWIAFLRALGDGKAAVMLVSPLGGSERTLSEVRTPWNPLASAPLTWSPEGDSLVVFDRESVAEACSLHLLVTDSGEKRRLTSPLGSSRGDGGPAFSPDGRSIGFVRTEGYALGDLYLLSLADGMRALAEPKKLTSGRWLVGNAAWAPDGRDLIFSVGNWGSGSLWRVAATGSDQPRLLAVGEQGRDVAVSSPRNRLAYSRVDSDVNIWRVEVSSLPGKTRLERFISSTRNETNAQFSPDGTKIVFSSDRSGASEIWICDSDGSKPAPLTSFGRLETASPRWSPDSRWISFDSNVEGQFEIYVVNANGGKPRRLTSHTALDAVPSWSWDGKWIYFASNRTGNRQVWKMSASGGEPTQVTQHGGFVPLESLDGKFVYYTKDQADTTVWRVPSHGGEEIQVLGPIRFRNFTVTRDGIYFIPQPESGESHVISFLSFATGKIRPVASIQDAVRNYISVSPDGRWILYPKLDLEGSDLMLVENFR